MCKDATQKTEQYVVVIECDDNKEFVFETEECSREAGIEVYRTIRILVRFVDQSRTSIVAVKEESKAEPVNPKSANNEVK
jgi:hypothetical protein